MKCALVFACVVVASVSAFPRLAYNHACPKPTDIQADFVAKSFNISKFEGTWYELAYHDLTESIPQCKCQKTVKKFYAEENALHDEFSMTCFPNTTYISPVSNKLTSTPGVFESHWVAMPLVAFPDTVVAVGLNKTNQNWRWAIEFQCVELPTTNRIVFTSINFWHRMNKVPKTELDEMFAAARTQGLGEYMDAGAKVTMVDHSKCEYPIIV